MGQNYLASELMVVVVIVAEHAKRFRLFLMVVDVGDISL